MTCPNGISKPCSECSFGKPVYVPVARREAVGFRSHAYLRPSCEFAGWNKAPDAPLTISLDYAVTRCDHLQAEINYLTNKLNAHVDIKRVAGKGRKPAPKEGLRIERR